MAIFRHEGHIFFIYNHNKKTEADDPKDAILYFYPAFVDIEDQIALVGAVIGLVDFCLDVLPKSMPSILKLSGRNFALLRQEDYIIGLGGSPSIPDTFLSAHLKFVWSTFVLYQGSLSAVRQRVPDNSFTQELKNVWDYYLPLRQIQEDALSEAFQVIPYVQLHKSQGHLFLRASHILQRSLKYKGVLGGALFNRSKVLCTQLSNSLTRQLLLLMSHSQFPTVEVSSVLEVPGGVRLLHVFLPRSEFCQLGYRRQKAYVIPETRERKTESSSESGGGPVEPTSPEYVSATFQSDGFHNNDTKTSGNKIHNEKQNGEGNGSDHRSSSGRDTNSLAVSPTGGLNSGTDSEIYLDTVSDMFETLKEVKLTEVKQMECATSQNGESILSLGGLQQQDGSGSRSYVDVPESAGPNVDVPESAGPILDVLESAGPNVDVVQSAGPNVDVPYSDGPNVNIPQSDGPNVEVPESAGPNINGPQSTGPNVDGPQSTGPNVDGPQSTDPNVAVPQSDDPNVAVPQSDGPNVAVPQSDGPIVDIPESAGPDVDVTHSAGVQLLSNVTAPASEYLSGNTAASLLIDSIETHSNRCQENMLTGSGENSRQKEQLCEAVSAACMEDTSLSTHPPTEIIIIVSSHEAELQQIQTTIRPDPSRETCNHTSQLTTKCSDSADSLLTSTDSSHLSSPPQSPSLPQQPAQDTINIDDSLSKSQLIKNCVFVTQKSDLIKQTNVPVIVNNVIYSQEISQEQSVAEKGKTALTLEINEKLTNENICSVLHVENTFDAGLKQQNINLCTDSLNHDTNLSLESGLSSSSSVSDEIKESSSVFEAERIINSPEESSFNVSKILALNKELIDASLDVRYSEEEGSTQSSDRKSGEHQASSLSLALSETSGNKDRITFESGDSEYSEGILFSPSSCQMSPVSELSGRLADDLSSSRSGSENGIQNQLETLKMSGGDSRSTSDGRSKDFGKNSTRWNPQKDDLEEMTLYAQGHSDTLLVLLISRSVKCNKTYINSLWRACLSHLADLDFQLKDSERYVKDDERENIKSQHQYIKYDSFTHSLKGSALEPVTSLANEIMDSSIGMHDCFIKMPDLQEITYRSHSASCLGQRNICAETYIQMGLLKPSAGINPPYDKTFYLDQLADKIIQSEG